MSRLDAMDEEYAELVEQGKNLQALLLLEKTSLLRRETLGIDHPDVQRSLQVLVMSYNGLSMAAVRSGGMEVAWELLRKAERLAGEKSLLRNKEVKSRLLAVTYNNLGCFYRARGSLHSALKALDRALWIEMSCSEVDNPAATHLNIAAVLSQLSKHRAALEHIDCALQLLERGDERFTWALSLLLFLLVAFRPPACS
ncbi:hypothetical protein GUITHDRAFT_81640 [Guillardia theta CCMP2712]|uniref:Uncharacterized protein n=1 Tax=Guillardia theta (strain CCMP2712) TaxID=905079 RepID=L1IAE7_GUITC|nr:hypothetical protein GUITHDRAFT_81640 [Guillardia theta CCMP2712]EKX33236.1 hypothetical protein GUITHDRAFT_81640 [Guillardia theta CCMP2712]|eukprot:XP_005820216.1 hypothetical protein GUITHDRAFT_81640 [Guillardia theta CCMP2712]